MNSPDNISSFIAIVKKYLQGEATLAEEEFIGRYYDAFEQAPEVLNSFTEEEKLQLENELKARILSGIAIPGEGRSKVVPMGRRIFIRVAAAAVLIGIVWIGAVNWTGIMNYLDPEQFEVQKTEKGQMAKISLSDGSVVWLNADSRLTYPAVFKRGPRRVKLEGEAYFEVAHNKSRPFLIAAAGLNTQVMGTSFDIKAYPSDKKAMVTVLTGIVEVSRSSAGENNGRGGRTVSLNPDEQLTYDKLQGGFSKQVVADPTDEIDWKDGGLVFNGAPMEEVILRLSRRYNLELAVPVEMRHITIYANLQNASGEEAVKSIARILGATYTRSGQTYTLRKSAR